MKLRSLFVSGAKYLMTSLSMGAVVMLCTYKMSASPLTTVIQAAIGIFVYLLFMYLSKEDIFMEILALVKKKFMK